MKLRFSPMSPYVRKVTVTAIETGLKNHIDRIDTNVWAADTSIGDDNPIGKVPTLITDGGEVLHDSSVICEYLDSLHDGAKLFPAAGGARWAALRLQDLGNGLAEAGTRRLLEQRIGGDNARKGWIARNNKIMLRCFSVLDDEVAGWGDDFKIGQITVACATGWIDFRFPDLTWRADNPAMAAWFEKISGRRSMKETMPEILPAFTEMDPSFSS